MHRRIAAISSSVSPAARYSGSSAGLAGVPPLSGAIHAPSPGAVGGWAARPSDGPASTKDAGF